MVQLCRRSPFAFLYMSSLSLIGRTSRRGLLALVNAQAGRVVNVTRRAAARLCNTLHHPRGLRANGASCLRIRPSAIAAPRLASVAHDEEGRRRKDAAAPPVDRIPAACVDGHVR